MIIALAVNIKAAAAPPSLRVYSEFQRPDPFGGTVPIDRAARPREILSPAVARNAWSSFHVVVTAPEGGSYLLQIGLNPEDAVQITLYREHYQKYGNGFIPDGLTKVELPHQGTIPEPSEQIPGQISQGFWLDVWVPRTAPVRRIKIDPMLYINDHWIIYPMEVRITAPIAPDIRAGSANLPSVFERADVAACRVWTGPSNSDTPAPPGIRAFSYRNALQDVALAATDPQARALALACQKTPAPDQPGGAEWYLQIRDRLLRERAAP